MAKTIRLQRPTRKGGRVAGAPRPRRDTRIQKQPKRWVFILAGLGTIGLGWAGIRWLRK